MFPDLAETIHFPSPRDQRLPTCPHHTSDRRLNPNVLYCRPVHPFLFIPLLHPPTILNPRRISAAVFVRDFVKILDWRRGNLSEKRSPQPIANSLVFWEKVTIVA